MCENYPNTTLPEREQLLCKDEVTWERSESLKKLRNEEFQFMPIR